MKAVFWFFVVLMVISMSIVVVNVIESSKINSWLQRAKDAGNPAQTAEFLVNYKQALHDANRVENKYATLFKYLGTYMPIYIRAIDGLIVRAEALSIQDATQTSYQMGLVNLEKDLGDIEPTAWSVWFANGGWIGVWVWVISACGCIVTGFAWAMKSI